jgi:Dimethlysulfonioproprionate lyase
MTSLRSADLQLFLTSAEAAIRHQSGVDGPVRLAAERMFTALQTPSTQAARPGSARLPVCRHLATTLEHTRRQPGPIGALADAFAGIEPQLTWKVRAGAETLGEQFLDGHANATIMGTEGLEIRRDVWIGVSLMAPHTRYPDHRHPPEEIYVVLSDGNGVRRAIHGMSLVSVAWYTILRTSCTRCVQWNGPCWHSGSFGRNRSAPDLAGTGCDEAYI